MQNECNNCGQRTEYVSLDGSWGSVRWNCGNCGCSNCGCDNCSNCGWTRCGCNNSCGSVVCTESRRNRNSDDCDKDGDAVNTRQRSSCECEQQSRTGNCGCKNATYGSRSLYVERCDDNTCVRDFSAGCDEYDNTAYARRSSCDKCDGCSGITYTRQSHSSDKCGECTSTACTQRRSNDNCGNDNGSGCGRSRKNRGVGMVWAAEQELDQIFESESALRSGTLFPELHKPMNGYCPGECNCQTDEQAAAFAAWELRLYLNTHPNDKQALALFRKLCREADDPNYATSFLKDTECCSGWDWTDDPWPWECRPCGR